MTDRKLVRGISLRGATALNMIDMVGVGPFITIPLIIAAMGGPQAMIGWIVGAMICLCDGLVWAELGAAMPEAGGSYHYLREIYSDAKFGKLISFLFIFQLSFSAPLSIASGCVGLASYSSYIFPSLNHVYFSIDLKQVLPFFGSFEASLICTNATLLAIATVMVALILLYRKVEIVSKISQYIWMIVFGTILWIIISGVLNFNPNLAFSFPENAFVLDSSFFMGLGAAMLIALYDYWGYYNVCFFGGEVENPGRNIPRAIIYSIVIISVLYIVMNISIIGVLPWQEVSSTAGSDARKYIVSVFMEKIFGTWAGTLAAILISITAFASVFSLILGYSRVPYAASLKGDYFKIFSKVHPKHHIPHISLFVMGFVACIFCFMKLKDIIAALVVIRILIQFIAQTIGVMYLRYKKPEIKRPFKIWLYPLPAIISLCGFFFVLFSRDNFQKEIKYALLLVIAGTLIFFGRKLFKPAKSSL